MLSLATHENRIFPLKFAKKLIIFIIFVVVFDFFLFSAPVLAGNIDIEASISEKDDEIIVKKESNKTIKDSMIYNKLPDNSDLKVAWTANYTMTAYNSEVAQCDASPCITANGFNVCEHGIEDTVAANFLKFGTKIRIPEMFGDRIFVVRDRMNSRYTSRIDIWMQEKQSAIQFGVQYMQIEVLEP
ncbi:3D domain-containing protein [Candidatus Parcubacteria bacterium]|nr:3D domain-containing protein [Candidatus Parcubacteria bacterium]